jgi:hypothetical protein
MEWPLPEVQPQLVLIRPGFRGREEIFNKLGNRSSLGAIFVVAAIFATATLAAKPPVRATARQDKARSQSL